MKLHVSKKQFKIIREILVGDYEVYFFGSRVKGTQHKFSDLDICLKAKEEIPMQTIAELNEKFIESDLPFTIDLVDFCKIDNSFRESIKKQWVNLNDSIPAT